MVIHNFWFTIVSDRDFPISKAIRKTKRGELGQRGINCEAFNKFNNEVSRSNFDGSMYLFFSRGKFCSEKEKLLFFKYRVELYKKRRGVTI